MAKTKNSTADIIVSGGGIAGLTFALLMADLGLDIHLIDPSAPPPLKDTNPSGRTVALMQNSLNIIKAAGLDAPEEFGASLKTMRIIDNSIAGQSEQVSDFESIDIGMDAYGYNIPIACCAVRFMNWRKSTSILLCTFRKNLMTSELKAMAFWRVWIMELKYLPPSSSVRMGANHWSGLWLGLIQPRKITVNRR